MTALLLDHLWQSSAVLAVIALLTLFLRNNGASVRFALWIAGSLKFLAPFAVLNMSGIHLARLMGINPPPLGVIETLYAAGQPFSDGPIFRALPTPGLTAWCIILGVWLATGAAILVTWVSRSLKLRTIVRAARPADIAAPMAVKISSRRTEPGLVGIFRPVLLLPEGVTGRLAPAELRAVIAHEACHMRRHDNFWAALHMLVQSLFWFWPPVWWLGARLIAERERACDEAVLAAGNDAQTYATSILKVCKHYVQLPPACAAGVAGANLNQRMETIMENRPIVRLNRVKKSLLGACAAGLVVAPLAAGLLWSPAAQGAACRIDPVRATHTPPPYPPGSAKAHETGAVLLQVTIARNGYVRGAKVAHGSGFARLDQRAASFVRQNYRWQPLACGSARTDVKVVFKLAEPPAAKPPVRR